MDASYKSDLYDGTPLATPIVSNDSGYITATPSPLCNDTPLNKPECERRSSFLGIHNTPLGGLKYNKTLNLRKYYLKESSVNSTLEVKLEEKEVCSSKSKCLCLPLLRKSGNKNEPFMLERNKSLAECFCHLKVVDDCEKSENYPMKFISDSVKRVISEDRLIKFKNKSPGCLTSVSVKKFRSDSNSVSSFCNQATSRDSSFQRRSFIGVAKLDFLVHLSGDTGSFPYIVSKILNYLPPGDLVNVCLVSSVWLKVCLSDPVANNRRLVYVRHIKQTKENIMMNEFKQVSHPLNVSLSSHKGIFREIQNTDRSNSICSTPPSPRSPPVSPSKIRFTLFMKAGVALDEGKRLVRCPRCSHPSQATYDHARCQAVGCQFIFCLFCLCECHEGRPCPGTRSVVQTRRRSSCVGSKESRRNLRRL